MARTPESCPYRMTPESGHAYCRILQEMSGAKSTSLCKVRHDACIACCDEVREPAEGNTVVASLLYGLCDQVIADAGHVDLSLDVALALRERAAELLTLDLPDADQSFPVPTRPPAPHPALASGTIAWAVGMLAAPRAVSLVADTTDSLIAAGFDRIHIFAEPGSHVPQTNDRVSISFNQQRLGNIRNFCSALAHLRRQQPNASAYAIFQDDIRAAQGLRHWLEQELWPQQSGIVSLFTPRVHSAAEKGWHLLSPGFQRVCGAQALVFQPQILDRFLADPLVIRCILSKEHGDDAVLGGWICREQLRIAYHTPSPIQHVGYVSSIYDGAPDQRNLANAVQHVDHISAWSAHRNLDSKIGLIGWNTPTGLGSMNRDLSRHLGLDRWLIPQHPHLSQCDGRVANGVTVTPAPLTESGLRNWLDSLDWLLFVERPLIDELPRMAAHMGIGIACIPMWEWIQPSHAWLQFVDTMICPTKLTWELMEDWKLRYGFGWKTVRIRWPIDEQNFEFQQRSTCQKFLFVNGWGGGTTVPLTTPAAGYQRKGLELILEAAAMAPDLKFVVHSLAHLPGPLPENIEHHKKPCESSKLYTAGDVCVQPSHYEGLGLQLLECQAAGMPLITTNAAPMNEHNPWKTIPVLDQEAVTVGDGFIPSNLMAAEDLVATLRSAVNRDIAQVSRDTRQHIVASHNWTQTGPLIRNELCIR